MTTYSDFLNSKIKLAEKSGFEIEESKLNKHLFPFQKFIVTKALKAGKFAVFADCGLGKTLMQLEWANQVSKHTSDKVLILTPLAVKGQTIKEAQKFKIPLERIDIWNYEQLDNLDCSQYSGVVLDESSILKNYTGATKQSILELFEKTPYKLACTATPSPNDELEIGNHSEFLNVMTSQDMRAVYFTTDKEIIKGEKYRLKRHAIKDFYRWISTWAVMISKPSDIGFDDAGYNLPELNFIEKNIKTAHQQNNGLLFNSVAVSASNFNGELRKTQPERLGIVADIVNKSTESFIIWIKQNEEGEYLRKLIPDAIEVKGSDSVEYKEKMLLGFASNEYRVLITKTKIAQFGLNFQNCHNQIFASLDFSFEGLYQAIRRSYRFGQTQDVNIYLITTDTMQNVVTSIRKKEEKFRQMQREMKLASEGCEIKEAVVQEREVFETEQFTLVLDDCVEDCATLPDNSIDYSFFSPPFGAMYVFSNNPKDMSNVKNNDEFLAHFRFLVKDLYRVIKPGRLVTIHMMQSTTLLGRDGYYSIVDFRGDLIRLFQSCGFYFHAECMIRKDPKTAAIRTKNHQLMHGSLKKDSSIVRPGLADFLLTFRKPGENHVPILNNVPFDLWCEMAEPNWIDIDEGDTLNYREAREFDDERHITATQLKPIEWSYLMWVNKGELVYSPFSGIGSEGCKAIEMGMRFRGVELKKSYYETSKRNLSAYAAGQKQMFLF